MIECVHILEVRQSVLETQDFEHIALITCCLKASFSLQTP